MSMHMVEVITRMSKCYVLMQLYLLSQLLNSLKQLEMITIIENFSLYLNLVVKEKSLSNKY
jgi:hypothetical protein